MMLRLGRLRRRGLVGFAGFAGVVVFLCPVSWAAAADSPFLSAPVTRIAQGTSYGFGDGAKPADTTASVYADLSLSNGFPRVRYVVTAGPDAGDQGRCSYVLPEGGSTPVGAEADCQVQHPKEGTGTDTVRLYDDRNDNGVFDGGGDTPEPSTTGIIRWAGTPVHLAASPGAVRAGARECQRITVNVDDGTLPSPYARFLVAVRPQAQTQLVDGHLTTTPPGDVNTVGFCTGPYSGVSVAPSKIVNGARVGVYMTTGYDAGSGTMTVAIRSSAPGGFTVSAWVETVAGDEQPTCEQPNPPPSGATPGSGTGNQQAGTATCEPSAALSLVAGEWRPRYWLAAADGGVFAFGVAGFLGSATVTATSPIAAVVANETEAGYVLAGTDGNTDGFGDAGGIGRPLDTHDHPLQLQSPITGMAIAPESVPPGGWLAARDGGVFALGAPFFGSIGGRPLNKPVVGIAATPTNQGYWLVASDGGVFAFGDAPFLGSTGNLTLNKPVVGIAATPSGEGYWLVASDGGIFAFGDAAFLGSAGNLTLNKPVVGIAATPTGHGYWLVASDGGIFAFGDAPFLGSTGNLTLNSPITGITS
jgi:hypothetical protein